MGYRIDEHTKQGYPESDEYHKRRRAFEDYLLETGLDWVEVCYGTDDGFARIVADAWDTENPIICPGCQGTRLQPGRSEKECDRCEGTGFITED